MRAMALAFALTISTAALGQDSYLCIADAIAGVDYSAETKRWTPSVFNHADKKYAFRRAKPGEKSGDREFKWGLYRFGSTVPRVACPTDFGDGTTIFCNDLTLFSFNKTTLRFQSIYPIGYVLPLGKEGNDTPAIEIGTCSPL
jgi:hypothetical protein